MNALTGAEVWTATKAEPIFVQQFSGGSAAERIIQPFIEAAPKALAEHLGKPLTLETLTGAKIAFLKYCLENGFPEAMSEAAGMATDLFASLLSSALELLEEMAENIPAFLEECGVTEEDVMLSEKINLNEQNRPQYLAGTLTIADVLRTQPSIILKNS